MKSSFVDNTETPDERPFPKLMRNTGGGVIVLFTSYLEGTVVAQPVGTNTLGKHRDNWVFETFVDFFGSVTLTEE